MPHIFPPQNAEEYVGKQTRITATSWFRVYRTDPEWSTMLLPGAYTGTHTDNYPGWVDRTTFIVPSYSRREVQYTYAVPGWTKPAWYDISMIWRLYSASVNQWNGFNWLFAWMTGIPNTHMTGMTELIANPIKTPVANGHLTYGTPLPFPAPVLIETPTIRIDSIGEGILTGVAPPTDHRYGYSNQENNYVEVLLTFLGYDDKGMSPLFMGFPL